MARTGASAEDTGLRLFGGAVAVLTGGASGIGRALGEALAARGARVVLADRQGELAEQAASQIRKLGQNAEAAELDVRDAEAVEHLVDDVVARHGRLDFVFNNAGIGIGGEQRLHRVEDWNQIVAVNLMGVVHGIHAAYPVMLRQGFGHIVNTASMAGLLPGPGMASYVATKHAVVGLSRSLRLEAAPAGVRVSVLCPGAIRTPILDGGRYGRYLEAASVAARREVFERMRPLDPARFAERALRQLARNRAIVIVPAWWRLLWWLERASPALSARLSARAYRRVRERLVAAREAEAERTA